MFEIVSPKLDNISSAASLNGPIGSAFYCLSSLAYENSYLWINVITVSITVPAGGSVLYYCFVGKFIAVFKRFINIKNKLSIFVLLHQQINQLILEQIVMDITIFCIYYLLSRFYMWTFLRTPKVGTLNLYKI